MNGSIAEARKNTQAMVGVVHKRDLGHISAMDIERFGVAVGHPPTGEVGARVAHPLFLTAVLGWGSGPNNQDLRPDGTEVLDTDAIPLAGLRLMGGGQSLELHRDVVEGMTVRAEMSLEGVEVKDGSTGQLLLLHLVRRYYDQDDNFLVTCRETLMAR